MSAYYIDHDNPDLGCYEFWQHSKTREWRWSWTEFVEGEAHVETSEWFSSLSWAMRNAAVDWEQNGNSSNRRFAGMLRGLAMKAEKREANV